VLRRYLDDETVDLVYLDPPFQSGKDYNLLFKREDGSRPAAQIKAFTDTWRWDQSAMERMRSGHRRRRLKTASHESGPLGRGIARPASARNSLWPHSEQICQKICCAPFLC
jgi:hypothetical protein